MKDVDAILADWEPFLRHFDAQRQERLRSLLESCLSSPLTPQQWAARWERVLAANGARIPAKRRIADLETALEEAIAVVREQGRGQ
jgi:hypothetical protein